MNALLRILIECVFQRVDKRSRADLERLRGRAFEVFERILGAIRSKPDQIPVWLEEVALKRKVKLAGKSIQDKFNGLAE